jgi:Peptidase_C39 like family
VPDQIRLRRLVFQNSILIALLFLGGCSTTSRRPVIPDSGYFLSLTNFSVFSRTSDSTSEESVLTSPEFTTPRSWNELVTSWNAAPGVYLKVEARVIHPDHTTRFYTMGLWSDDPSRHPRESVTNQADADGDVHTDTLVLNEPATNVQVRLTIGGASATDLIPVKFLGLSFCDSHAPAITLEPSRKLWGRSLDVPQRVQSGYDGPGGWCSPASLSMVLAYWSGKLGRPELDRPVPEVAAAVNDPVYGGTGNWPFNTAYAGQFPGMRAYVTRLADISELEPWIAAGVPVVMSVSSYLTNDRHDGPDNGHLIVCLGFTKTGDMVVNDPGVSLKRGESVRRIYPRERVINAWKKSKNTVYLVYPETWPIPEDRRGHWERK